MNKQMEKPTLPETNITLKIGHPKSPKGNYPVVFQPSIFRGYVSFREGIEGNFENIFWFFVDGGGVMV